MTLSDTARELELYATNVEAYFKPIVKTLAKKHRNAEFHYERAIHCVERYCLTPAAKQYNLENGSMSTPWHTIFPKNVRLEAAESIVNELLEEFRIGNYWD
jgi:hypothetical protein